jgi:hypothetical protein
LSHGLLAWFDMLTRPDRRILAMYWCQSIRSAIVSPSGMSLPMAAANNVQWESTQTKLSIHTAVETVLKSLLTYLQSQNLRSTI